MKPSLIHVCNARNPAQSRLRVTCTREHVTRAPEHAPLEEQAEATILAVLAAVICASLSVGLVIGIGLCRTLGAR